MSGVAGPLLALLSSLLWGAGDFLGGLASRSRVPIAVVGGSQVVGLLAVLLVAAGTGAADAPSGWVPWSVAAAAFGTSALVAFYVALARGRMGVVSPVAALGVVVPVLLGMLAGERPSSLQVVGMVVAVLGAVGASGPELRGRGDGGGALPVVLAAGAGVGFGLTLYCLARGSESSAVMTLVGMRASSLVVLAAAALVARSVGGLTWSDAPVLVAIGLFDAGANLAVGLATTYGLVSLTAVLGSLYPVVTVLLARAVLGERLGPVQSAGVGAALVGVALIAAG